MSTDMVSRGEMNTVCTQEQSREILSRVSDTARAVFGQQLCETILYGSYARGDFDSESDMDIMVLADVPCAELSRYKEPFLRLSSELGLENDIVITITLKDKETFERYLSAVPFYQAVRKEGISIYDDFHLISKGRSCMKPVRAETRHIPASGKSLFLTAVNAVYPGCIGRRIWNKGVYLTKKYSESAQ